MGLVVVLILILLFVFFLRKQKVKNLKFFDWIHAEYWPEKQEFYYIRFLDRLGFVVSKDKKIYKLHLKTTFRASQETSINNTQLFISGLGWFVKRINFEFEPREGWVPLSFNIGQYKSLIKVKLLDRTIKHKFVFQVREQNIVAIKNPPYKTSVVEVPIIQN